jgi:hypothetical protein
VCGQITLTRNTDADYLRLPQILDHLSAAHPGAVARVDCRDSHYPKSKEQPDLGDYKCR